MANLITGIISITIGAVILASVFISTLKNTTTKYGANGTADPRDFTTAELAMWGLLSLIGIVGLLYGLLSVFGLA